MADFNAPRVKAILGPTNTGKTHYAIERMLSYPTGVIGLPLRLLAREIYDKLVALRGPSVIALVTGEERIIPPRTKYWVATVESMPQSIGADCVIIDEVQLCADPERGHIFTERILKERGTCETLFLGSTTMRNPLRELINEIEFISRDRFSNLTYTGSKKISRLKERTAIVGFSVDNVYSIAELLRRQKGGAAVVMGALSPRTRNAQVALYQNGDVDYLVATDAIGMGLNLDINHIAFSNLTKFDGRKIRPLAANELAQIAGRAGRYKNDGTFGITGEARPLEEGLIEAIETHRFTPLKQLQWRNSTLDFSSIEALLASLSLPSQNPVFVKAREADDQITLNYLSQDHSIIDRVKHVKDVQLLWDVCQLPDFRKTSPQDHASIITRLFEFLQDDGEISSEWLETRIEYLNKMDGDIDTLSKRLSFIRTFTYISQRKSWIGNSEKWQDAARHVEDCLSDALHIALTKRFVDRRTSVLMRRLKQKESLVAEVNEKGEVHIEGQFVGQLRGFKFQLDPKAEGPEAKTLRSAALQALQPKFNLAANTLYNAADREFDITEQGGLMWGDTAVGKLEKGVDITTPHVKAFVDDEAGAAVQEKVTRRLEHFVSRQIEMTFEPLFKMRDNDAITGLAKGLAYRITENLGVIPRAAVMRDVKELDQEARGLLRKHGIRFGQYTIFHYQMLKPAPTRLRLVLWGLFEGHEIFAESPPAGHVSIAEVKGSPQGYYPRAGYRLAGERAIRIDMLERLADMIRACDVNAGFETTPDMLSITGMKLDQFASLMESLGYHVEKEMRAKIGKQKQKQDPASSEQPEPSGQSEPSEQPETEMETAYRFKWIPKSSHNKRKPQENRASQKPSKKPWKKGKPKGQQFDKVKPTRYDKAAEKRATDPDNPFAALAALKRDQ